MFKSKQPLDFIHIVFIQLSKYFESLFEIGCHILFNLCTYISFKYLHYFTVFKEFELTFKDLMFL